MKIGTWEINLQRLLAFAGFFILVLLVMDFNSRLEALTSKTEKLENVGAQATAVIETQIALETAVSHASSDAAVEEWAREQAHLVQPGDQPIVPIPAAGATLMVAPTPTPTPITFTKWDIWMELIFGK